jgi:hypothetical protein
VCEVRKPLPNGPIRGCGEDGEVEMGETGSPVDRAYLANWGSEPEKPSLPQVIQKFRCRGNARHR